MATEAKNEKPTSAAIAEAEKYKEQANEYFKNKIYDKAIEYYSKALELDPDNAVYYANRSLANLRTELFGCALQDAISSVKADPGYLKAYYRRAAAHMSLGKFKLALADFEIVSKRRPNDADAKKKFVECNKIVKKIAFERAIAVDKPEKTLAEMYQSLEAISIEDDYCGPVLSESTGITLEFMKELMEWYKDQKKLHKKFAYKILYDIDFYLRSQPSLVDIKIPDEAKFTICGDIHGQFYDLLNIFEKNGLPSETNMMLFNGDFVDRFDDIYYWAMNLQKFKCTCLHIDRGSFSVECIFTLFGFKLLYPNHFFMSRGNHESVNMNQMYGFTGEVTAKYNSSMADMFTQVFNFLPLSHLLNEKVFVCHGGLFSSDDVTIDDLRKIDRNRQPPEEGLMCELLWSDPQANNGRAPSKRGVGCQFGPDVTENFLKKNNLEYIVRSHEVKDMGYEIAHNGKCITVFSAPNYCDTMGNKGAYINLKGKNMKPTFEVFDAVPHPNVKPMMYASSLMNLIM